MEGERIACGTAHADNVAPALLGGFSLVRSYSPLDVIQLPSPTLLFVTCLTPDVEVKTADARRILRSSVPLKDAISQWGNVAALVAGIFNNNAALIGRSLEDRIIEPERAALIPGFYGFREAAMAAGALGFAISGSGPTMFAISDSQIAAEKVKAALLTRCSQEAMSGNAFTSRVNPRGAVRVGSDGSFLD
jgi:homoserine kinase